MEKVICPNCKRKLRNVNAWHYCQEVDIDDLFLKKSDDIILAFDKILMTVGEWEAVDVSATKNCVVFVKNKTFLVVKPMSKCLEVKFYSNQIIEDDALHKCTTRNNKKFEGVVRFENENQILPKFIQYFKDSYLLS